MRQSVTTLMLLDNRPAYRSRGMAKTRSLMRYMKYASLTLQTIRDFNLTDPTVRTQLRKRYGDQLPLSAPVIAPVSMFRSPLLVTIAER